MTAGKVRHPPYSIFDTERRLDDGWSLVLLAELAAAIVELVGAGFNTSSSRSASVFGRLPSGLGGGGVLMIGRGAPPRRAFRASGFFAISEHTIAAARDLGAGPMRAFVDVTLPLMRGSLVSSFVFAFLLSLNEYARAYYLVGRQNTLPLYMFGAMNSGASPAVYAFSGAVLVASFAAVALIFFRAARRQSGPPGVSLTITKRTEESN